MKEWQSRVFDELSELHTKIKKLEHFLATADVPNKGLLHKQHAVMVEYATILDIRVKGF